MFDGRAESLYGLAAGFSGVGVFCRAASRSPLLRERDTALAEELAAACFRDILAFGGFLLNEYPDTPEERDIARRFEGGYGFADGLAGFLWALERCRDAGDGEGGQMLDAFKRWHIDSYSDAEMETLLPSLDQPWPDTDILAGGLAWRAVSMLLAYERGEDAAPTEAGRLLAWKPGHRGRDASLR